MVLKWLLLAVLLSNSTTILGQDWSWPEQEKIVKNTCSEKEISVVPDIEAIPLNIHEFGKRVSASPEVEFMREAGVLSCSIKIRFLIDESGSILCYSLKDKCHPVWEIAILRFIDCLEFWPAYKNSKPISSEVTIRYRWIFEW